MGYSAIIFKGGTKKLKGSPNYEHGAMFVARKVTTKTGCTRFINVTIGKVLASKLGLTAKSHNVSLLFGDGEEAGQLAVKLDQKTGPFIVTRATSGKYGLTINAPTAADILALEFKTFYDEKAQAIQIKATEPAWAVFNVESIMVKL